MSGEFRESFFVIDFAVANFLNEDIVRVKNKKDIECIPLRKIKLYVLVNRFTPLAHFQTLNLEQIKDEFIALAHTGTLSNNMLITMLDKKSCTNKIVVNSPFISQQMVAENKAVSFATLDSPLISGYEEKIARVELSDDLSIITAALYKKQSEKNNLINAAIKGW